MSIVAELASQPGVIVAGEYSYRGDRFHYKGSLTEEQARMASIMCRATNLSAHMQAHILATGMDPCPFNPARGWSVRGPRFTVCVMANVFCFLDNRAGSVNDILHLMGQRLGDQGEELI
jgi:roadblock/LC7 domain-containing protein